jgi:quinolinate synthase
VIGSTQALLNYAIAHSEERRFIVATESGILHEMQKACPEVEFIPVPALMDDQTISPCNECEYMRMNTLEKLYKCLLEESNEIFVDKQVADDAIISIRRMLEMS